MVVGILTKLQHGNYWQKIGRSWKTAKLIKDIGTLLRQVGSIICTHVFSSYARMFVEKGIRLQIIWKIGLVRTPLDILILMIPTRLGLWNYILFSVLWIVIDLV